MSGLSDVWCLSCLEIEAETSSLSERVPTILSNITELLWATDLGVSLLIIIWEERQREGSQSCRSSAFTNMASHPAHQHRRHQSSLRGVCRLSYGNSAGHQSSSAPAVSFNSSEWLALLADKRRRLETMNLQLEVSWSHSFSTRGSACLTRSCCIAVNQQSVTNKSDDFVTGPETVDLSLKLFKVSDIHRRYITIYINISYIDVPHRETGRRHSALCLNFSSLHCPPHMVWGGMKHHLHIPL